MPRSALGLALLGAGAWALGMVLLRPEWPAALLLLAAFVVVPLGRRVVTPADRHGRHPLAHRASLAAALPAAFLLVGAFAYPPSWLAAGLSVPWMVTTWLVATDGLARLLRRGPRPVEELVIDLGALGVAAGGVWVVLSRRYDSVLGFSNQVALLTAVHFHYAGFAAPTLLGLAGRALRGGAPRALAAALLLAVPVLAWAIQARVPRLEHAAGWLMVLAGWGLACAQLWAAHARRPTPQAPALRPDSRVLLTISALSLFFALGLAAVFAARSAWVVPWVLDIDRMALLHGTANAVGFALAGLLGWALAPPRPRGAADGAPLSGLRGGWRVAEDYARSPDGPPGLLPSIDALRSPELPTDRLDPRLRAFYEQTARHALALRATWTGPWGAVFRALGAVPRAIGQLAFPTSEAVWAHPSSRIVALTDLQRARDGRASPSAWVLAIGERPMSVSVFATHEHSGTPYVGVTFPLPLGNLTSVVRASAAAASEARILALVLTNGPRADGADDTGVWLVTPAGPLRLPLVETISVWTSDAEGCPFPPDDEVLAGATVVARHELRCFGSRFLVLDYVAAPRSS